MQVAQPDSDDPAQHGLVADGVLSGCERAVPMRLITTSEIRTYQRCREEHRLTYLQGYRPEEPATALAFGTAIHAGLEQWWQPGELPLRLATSVAAQKAAELGLDVYERVAVQVMLEAYHAHWQGERDQYVVRSLETVFERDRDGYQLGGRYDGLIEADRPRRLLVLEHKTTSEEIAPGTEYWSHLALDRQIDHYLIASQASGVLYDVLRKPKIRPERATPIDRQKRRKDGQLYAGQREADETPQEWEARLRAAYADEEHGPWFVRREVVRLPHELHRANRELDQLAGEIVAANPNRPAPRTGDSCRRYGRRCDYWLACTGQVELHELPLRRATATHEELA